MSFSPISRFSKYFLTRNSMVNSRVSKSTVFFSSVIWSSNRLSLSSVNMDVSWVVLFILVADAIVRARCSVQENCAAST